MLLPMIHKAKIPIVLHYDHGLTAELIVKALRWGFSSVMYDCSRDSYSENIRKCAEMVKIAKSFGATVEGELGHVGSGNAGSIEGGNQDTSIYTDPQQAAEFVTKTGVDALAVAIGTAHGPYLTKPKLDIARLCEISEKVEIPLVLHGGSGLSDDDFRNCIKSGICKINIFTDIDRAGLAAVKKASSEGAKYLTDILPFMMKGVKEAARVDIHPGGAVANTGLALKIFGADVTLMGKIGNDAFGQLILSALESYGAAKNMSISRDSATSYSVVLAPPGTDRIFLHNPGANDTFGMDDLDFRAIQNMSLFHFGYPTIMKTIYENKGAQLIEIFKKVKGLGVATSLDMAALDEESGPEK